MKILRRKKKSRGKPPLLKVKIINEEELEAKSKAELFPAKILDEYESDGATIT